MREFYILLLVVVFGVQAQAQVCTITSANASQDFCTICSSGANPALVDGTFNGTLTINSRIDYTISESCLTTIVFEGNFTINVGFKSSLTFEVDPVIMDGTNVFADPNHHTQSGDIIAFGNTYKVRGNGLTYADFDNQARERAVLPVSLVDWTADEKAGYVDLRWTTSEEDEHEYFVVEHSTDGKHFSELIAVMQPQGSYEGLLRDYEYVHQLPAQGTNYYRLVQYDRGGKATTFDVRSVRLNTSATSTVHPNPAGAGETIGLKSREEVHEATLYRLDGTAVASYGDREHVLSEITLPHSLTSGTYVLRAGRQNHRIVVR